MKYDLELCEGKYALKLDEDNQLVAFRYGEPWRDLVGDHLIRALFNRIKELEGNYD